MDNYTRALRAARLDKNRKTAPTEMCWLGSTSVFDLIRCANIRREEGNAFKSRLVLGTRTRRMVHIPVRQQWD